MIKLWRLLKSLFSRTYVVIYDFRDPEWDDDSEEYYGYFSSKQEAVRMYRELSQGDNRYRNPQLCRVVKSPLKGSKWYV